MSVSQHNVLLQSASKMCREFAHKNWILFYKTDGWACLSLVQRYTPRASSCPSVMTVYLLCIDRNQLDVLDVLEGQVHTITLPINVKAVFLVAEDRWLLIESKTDRCLLSSNPNGHKLMLLVLVCVWLCPAKDWYPVQGVPRLVPWVSWDKGPHHPVG